MLCDTKSIGCAGGGVSQFFFSAVMADLGLYPCTWLANWDFCVTPSCPLPSQKKFRLRQFFQIFEFPNYRIPTRQAVLLYLI